MMKTVMIGKISYLFSIKVANGNPCGLIKILGETHLFVWVGTGEDPANSQRKLNVFIAKNEKTYPYYFLTPIIDVKLEQPMFVI